MVGHVPEACCLSSCAWRELSPTPAWERPRISVTKYRRVSAEIHVPRHSCVLRTAAMPLMCQKSFLLSPLLKNNSINEKIIFMISVIASLTQLIEKKLCSHKITVGLKKLIRSNFWNLVWGCCEADPWAMDKVSEIIKKCKKWKIDFHLKLLILYIWSRCWYWISGSKKLVKIWRRVEKSKNLVEDFRGQKN